VLPVSTEVAVDTPVTATGVVDDDVDPLPSWPDVPRPQHLMVPSDNVAQVCAPPAETEVAVEMPVTATGKVELVDDPLPSRPELPDPQHLIVPSDSVAHV
jgi:hypothetical protein